MSIFTWNENLSVKIKSIDDQHKKLIEMINDFYDNISKRTNNENIVKLLTSMKNYTRVHFTIEEKYMQHYKYPDYESHKNEHALFIAKVSEIEEKLKNEKLVLSMEMTMFLKDWLKQHIQGTDKKYSDFFIDKGIK